MGLVDRISDKINSLMEVLGKFAAEHRGSYLIVILAVTLGGVLSAILGRPFAVFVPLFILWAEFVAKRRHKKRLTH